MANNIHKAFSTPVITSGTNFQVTITVTLDTVPSIIDFTDSLPSKLIFKGIVSTPGPAFAVSVPPVGSNGNINVSSMGNVIPLGTYVFVFNLSNEPGQLNPSCSLPPPPDFTNSNLVDHTGNVPFDGSPTCIVVTCGVLGFNPVSGSTLPSGLKTNPYSQTIIISNTGGNPGQPNNIFAPVPGALPPGLSISTAANGVDAVISGTPTTAGTYTFQLNVIDHNGCTGNATYTIMITSCPVITISPDSLPNGSTGTLYNQSLSASGGVEPYTASLGSGSLPPGIELLPDGTITGYPTMAGVYSFVVVATDANGCTGTKSYTITINSRNNGGIGGPFGGGVSFIHRDECEIKADAAFRRAILDNKGISEANKIYNDTLTACRLAQKENIRQQSPQADKPRSGTGWAR